MPTPKNDPGVIQVLRSYRLALIAREEDQTKRLAASWLQLEQSLNDKILLLALQIQDAQANNTIITEQLLRRMDRYQQLQSQMKTEILDYAKDTAVPDIESEQLQYGKMAIQSASESIKMSAGLGVQFDKLPTDAVETYVGYLGDGTPLYRLLKETYPETLDGVIKSFLEGAAAGLNPTQIAFNASRSLDIGLERITLIARTEQLRVSRNVSADQYRASGLDGYMRRVATKDAAVCMACLMLDGQIIPLDEELDDHPRGRCVAVFQIKGSPIIQWEKGMDWFIKQEESLQRSMMGNEKFEMWKSDIFKLEDLARIQVNNTWGNSPRVATIKELAG